MGPCLHRAQQGVLDHAQHVAHTARSPRRAPQRSAARPAGSGRGPRRGGAGRGGERRGNARGKGLNGAQGLPEVWGSTGTGWGGGPGSPGAAKTLRLL